MEILLDKTLFWDCDPSLLDLKKNARFILERVLSRGDVSDFRRVHKLYDEETIKNVVINNRTLDERSQNFWCSYFNIDKNVCTQNQLSKKQGLFWKR